MESQAALVGAQGGVELDAVAAVDLGLALVVLPDDAELDDALGDGDDLERGLVFGVLLEEGAVFEGRGQLCLWGRSVSREIGREGKGREVVVLGTIRRGREGARTTNLCTPARTRARMGGWT